MRLPPGPPMHPVRQMFEFTFRPLAFLDECRAKYGDPFTVRMAGHGTFISLAAPELIKQAFTATPEEVHAGEANAILEPVLGKNSVLVLDEKPHARQRQLLMPPLHGERMRAYAQLMVDITRAELAKMPQGKAYALHPHMQAITLEVILRAVVGADAGDQLDRLRKVLLQFLVIPPTVVTFIPVKYMDFPLSPYRAFLARRALVDAQLDALIRERRGTAGTGRADVLSLLLDARDGAGQPMSDAELRDELLTMLMAGHETTATALSWAFGNILSRPEVESKLRAEVETARGQDGALDVAAVHKLEYLDGVIKESLRLTPIVPDVVRKLTKPMTVGGYELPAGVNLMPTIWLAHRRPESFSEPEQFIPERFIKQKLDPNAWLPFGGGVRRCLGMAFALYEMKIVLAQLLLDAELKLTSTEPLKVERRFITLAPTGGTRVVMARRVTN